jgi:hypothetical protein
VLPFLQKETRSTWHAIVSGLFGLQGISFLLMASGVDFELTEICNATEPQYQ